MQMTIAKREKVKVSATLQQQTKDMKTNKCRVASFRSDQLSLLQQQQNPLFPFPRRNG